jgi:hypothetical protein
MKTWILQITEMPADQMKTWILQSLEMAAECGEHCIQEVDKTVSTR